MTTTGLVDPDEHRKVGDLFHQALDLPPDEREKFVRGACPNAIHIADEVLSLLAAHEKNGELLNAPLPDSAQQLAFAADAALSRVGQTIGQYRIDGILGQGGMGVVYQAFDQRLNIVVALKAISPDVTKDPARRERLRREAQVVARLKHPGIAWVYALEEFDDDLFIAGEFIEGETLREQIGRGAADPAVVLDTAVQLADALAAAHDQGIIHRDLKPENVMRDSHDRIRILDFGLAQMRDLPPGQGNLTEAGKLFGTPAYMSPEQLAHESLGGRSDLFSLGIVLYELLTGVHPFDTGETAETISAIRNREPRPFRGASEPKPASREVTLGLEGIIRTLLRKAPTARFTSAHQLHAALERLRAGDRSAAVFGGVQTEAVRWWKIHQLSTCAFYLALLIPTWIARLWHDGEIGPWYFVAAIVAVVSAITLRWHLWFAAFLMPAEFAHQYQSNWKWVRAADGLLVAAVEASGFAVLLADPKFSGHSVVAVVLITGGVLALLGSFVIEPATTRAAFGRE
jgi:predicted Ser/Thr protein kinase